VIIANEYVENAAYAKIIIYHRNHHQRVQSSLSDLNKRQRSIQFRNKRLSFGGL